MEYPFNLLTEQIQKTEMEYGTSYLPVKEILQIPAFKGYKIIAGHQGLDTPCKHMTILETPEGVEWLRGEEFLLTTWYPFKNDDKVAKDILYRLHKRKVSAIGIKENRYLQCIPETMIEQSNKYGVPLIILPYELIYTDALSNFYESLFYNKNKYLLGLKEMYEKLSSLIFNSKNVQQVIDVLSMLTNSTIMVFDSALNILSIGLSDSQHKDMYNKVLEDIQTYGRMRTNTEVKIDDFFITMYTIDSEYKSIGYVCAISKSPADNLTQKIIRYGRMILYLKIVKEESEYLNTIKIKKAITEIIINKNDLSEEFYNNIKYAYDWQDQKNFVGICIAVEGKSEPDIHAFKEQLCVIISRIFQGKGFLITESDSKIFLFCSTEAISVQGTITKIKMFYKDFKDKLYLKFGLSKVYPHIKYISDMYNESLTAVAFYKGDDPCNYESLDIIKLLCAVKHDRQVYECYNNTILKIKEYDDESNGSLLSTLEAYFKHDMNKKMVSANLFIHPETLRYRLNKIEQLTGYSLNTSEGVFTLQMGLKLHKIINLK